MMKNKIISLILVSQMILCMFAISFCAARAASDTITISSKEDFIAFAKNCTLDTWSQNKTVNLTADIDFTDSDFCMVATFGGVFNGNSHTISGIDFTNKGSYCALFRYLQPNGKIQNLNVNAKFKPGGSKSFVAGIVAENNGTIENCTFSGSVYAQNVCGGICANNTDLGKIISCSAYGLISAQNFTGGIAGKNSGFIQNCTNSACVNTVYEEKKNSLSDINIETDTAAIIENTKTAAEENEEDSLLGHTDTGGIAGYSSGIIQGCINNSSVGYRHIGYNVGGICGRQAGYMLGCKNYGTIYGRKDVGGICGQTEPYTILNTSESNLANLRDELNTLTSMIDSFISDADSLSDDTKKHLDEISDYAKSAGDSTEALFNFGSDFIDDNLSEINAQSAILSNTLSSLTPVFDDVESGSDALSDALTKLGSDLDNIKISSPDLEDEIDEICDALNEISNAQGSVKAASSRFDRAVSALEQAIVFKNPTQVKNAASELSDAIKDMIEAKQTIKSSIEKIETIFKTKPEKFDDIKVNAKSIAENLKVIKDNVSIKITSLKTIKQSIDTFTLNTSINFSQFKKAAENIEISLDYIADAMIFITRGIGNLSDALKNTSDALDDYISDTTDQINNAKDAISSATDSVSFALDDITSAVRKMGDIIEDLANEDSLEFVKLGDDFRYESDNLFDSLDSISSEIDLLKTSVSDGGDKLTKDVRAISDQFNLLMNLLIDEVGELKNSIRDIDDIFIDASDEDIESAKQGKIADCQNFAEVYADRNTGGICGAMAIEYSKDPEDDIEKPNAFNFTYRSRSIIQSCINEGYVGGKKDCTGGICGLSEIGTIYECENYAKTESTNGNYVGGIVGKSESSVRKSYSKSSLSGKRYVGGIAGKAKTVSASYCISSINGEENTGAICGDIENINNLSKNFFIDCGIGAVDGISYFAKAEPIEYEELTKLSFIPEDFVSFKITFIADDKEIGKQNIKYGESSARINYPEIPEKDGYFGTWQEPNEKTITKDTEIILEYNPYITLLESKQKNDSGKLALALAEGNFTDKAELNITDSAQTFNRNTPNTKVYDISLLNTDISSDSGVTVRILNENKDKVSAWVLKDGAWESVQTTNKGKYTIIQTVGAQSTVCLKYEKSIFAIVLPTVICVVILLAVAAVSIVILKKIKKKKSTSD